MLSPDDHLLDALDQLTEAGLVSRRGVRRDATFIFKHALVQDAAYSALLRGPRMELHAPNCAPPYAPFCRKARLARPCTHKPGCVMRRGLSPLCPIATKFVRQRNMSRRANSGRKKASPVILKQWPDSLAGLDD